MLTPLLAAVGPVAHVLAVRPLEVLRSSVGEDGERTTYAGVGTGGLGDACGCSGATWVARAMLPISTEVAGMVAMLGAVVGIALIVPIAVRLLG